MKYYSKESAVHVKSSTAKQSVKKKKKKQNCGLELDSLSPDKWRKETATNFQHQDLK